ncbi:MAG: hypothetical protein KIH01_05950 [Candidatus Freyarchaeota archaeon]|nr:hypothetical protein [Candidatus Jordarchaeia archaeon]
MIKMVKRKSLAATGTLATLILTILLTATLATPTLATPTLATTNQPTTSQTPWNEMLQRGRIGTDYFDMKFADLLNNMPGSFTNVTYWTITPRNLGFKFNMHPAYIIEFNDINGNGILDDGDVVLRNISLSNMIWRLAAIGVENDKVWISFNGISSSLNLTVYIRVYFNDALIASPESATGPGYSTVVPGLRAVKVDIVVNNYNWVDGGGTSKLALVVILKCQQEAEYEYRYRLANGITFSNSDEASGFVPSISEDESEIGLVMAGNEHEVRARFRWFNYALCSDTEQRVVSVTSYFNVTEGGVELQLCVDHFGDSEVSFDPYFAVLSAGGEGLPAEAGLLLLYYVAGQSQVAGMMLVGAAVLLIAGVATAVYLRRR